jgi:hypothetical protein
MSQDDIREDKTSGKTTQDKAKTKAKIQTTEDEDVK